MKCPLLTHDEEFIPTGIKYIPKDCLEAECAWWYKGENCCAMTAIAIDLTAIFNMVTAIQKIMPHEQQFRK